jgi:hypothetical protein
VRTGAIFPCNEIGGDTGAVRAYVQAVEDLGYAHLEAFDTWEAEAAAWAELGATHLSLRTDESRMASVAPPRSVDGHIELLRRYATTVDGRLG